MSTIAAKVRARWVPNTPIESEVMLVVRDKNLRPVEMRLLVLLHNDVLVRADVGAWIVLDTLAYCHVLGIKPDALSRALHRCEEQGWVALGPRTSRRLTFRLPRLAQRMA